MLRIAVTDRERQYGVSAGPEETRPRDDERGWHRMRIVNPSFGQAVATGEKIKGGAVDWRKDPIVLFSNSKPNARELLEGLKAKLGGIRSVDNIDFIWKPSASQPASPELIDKVAHKYRAALLALGD